MKNLANFIENSEDPIINFELGKEYESIGQTGAAISFYLRTAERSSTDLQQYTALIQCCICLEKQKTRDDTEKGLLLKSIALIPTRPEAYFLLSRVHERRTEWQESYSMAVLGLELADFGTDSVIPENYPGYYSLLFQKGMTSWWVGLTEQSRQIMLFLKDHYKMLPVYETAVNNNLKNCGLPKIPLQDNPKWNTASDYMFPPRLPTAAVPIVTKSNIARTASTLINQQPMPGIWIVDNFYQNPDEIRKFALAQAYDQGGFDKSYIGDRTKQQFLFPGLREEFEYIMNRKIVNWESHAMNGRFQVCKEGEPLVYHCDEQAWAGMLYLTPGAPYHSGTSTHALKGTDIRHVTHPEIMKCFRPGSRNLDRTIFEPVDSLGNVYNRLVIFNAGYIHSATDYFGFNNENCRLWQMFFFD